MLFFHLLHILRQLLNAAPDLFHLGQQIGYTQPSRRARQRDFRGLSQGSGKRARPRGVGKRPRGWRSREWGGGRGRRTGRRKLLAGGQGEFFTCSKNSSMKWSRSTWTTSSSSSLSFACGVGAGGARKGRVCE